MKVGDRSRVDLTAQPILIRGLITQDMPSKKEIINRKPIWIQPRLFLGLIRYRFKRQSLPSLTTIIG